MKMSGRGRLFLAWLIKWLIVLNVALAIAGNLLELANNSIGTTVLALGVLVWIVALLLDRWTVGRQIDYQDSHGIDGADGAEYFE